MRTIFLALAMLPAIAFGQKVDTFEIICTRDGHPFVTAKYFMVDGRFAELGSVKEAGFGFYQDAHVMRVGGALRFDWEFADDHSFRSSIVIDAGGATFHRDRAEYAVQCSQPKHVEKPDSI